MDDWIVADPGVLGGKPCIKGTRLSVEHVLELLASGGSQEELLRAWPQLSPDGLAAALRYAARALKHEFVRDVKVPA